MLSHKAMIASGNQLFRWRGQLPMLLIPFFAWATLQGEPIERTYGAAGEAFAETLAFALLFGGLIIRALCAGYAPRGTSGRNLKEQIAESLTTTGLYSLCRNPLYVGNCMIYIGLAFYAQSLLLVAALCLLLALYYERIIMAEEDYLKTRFGQAYLVWAERVPAFVPRFETWEPPSFSFSPRTVLRREYPGWIGALIFVAGIDLGHELIEGAAFAEDRFEWGLTAFAVLVCLSLRLLKKRTRVLHESGR
ncbi:MAG: methyltransferase family protein [Paracoccaceae bacterium]